MSIFKKEKKVTVDSILEVKGWSDSFLAPVVLYVPDLEIRNHGDKTITAMISHCQIKEGTGLSEMVKKKVKERYNLTDDELLKYANACCFQYSVVVSRKFKSLSNKQKLVLLLLESYRAEGYNLGSVPILHGLTNADDVDKADALVHVTDLFGKMAVSGALKKQRKVFDQSCYRASSHKLFQKAPKEKIYTDRFLSQVEEAIAEEQETEQPQPEQPTPTPTPEPTATQQQANSNNTNNSNTNKGKGKGAA